jgi:hypothetical protein
MREANASKLFCTMDFFASMAPPTSATPAAAAVLKMATPIALPTETLPVEINSDCASNSTGK